MIDWWLLMIVMILLGVFFGVVIQYAVAWVCERNIFIQKREGISGKTLKILKFLYWTGCVSMKTNGKKYVAKLRFWHPLIIFFVLFDFIFNFGIVCIVSLLLGIVEAVKCIFTCISSDIEERVSSWEHSAIVFYKDDKNDCVEDFVMKKAKMVEGKK